jgi:hypothetical protein
MLDMGDSGVIRADNAGQKLVLGWSLHGWSRSDLLALAGLVAAIVIAVVPPLRRGVLRWRQATSLRVGFPQRRYARWFARTWEIYENPYLDDKENLDLSNTYVPLSFHSNEAARETLSIATTVLADRSAGNLVIEGAPGSGKSTLLKAYGVGVLQVGRALTRSGKVVPFLIQLRKLARLSNGQISIADYLISEILVSSVGMKPQRARQFLRYALAKDQVLVMLDGLDEVTTDRYRAIHEAVHAFVYDHRPDCPSYRARIILTCRRQNFMTLRDEWIPAIASRVCSLAPLRNSEIFSYLSKLRPKFRAAGGPESFIQAVRASGTLDLHRVPLILAMSVGLYARKDYYEIPSSIAKLYQAMIEEMLDRHRFKRDPVGAAVAFQLGDKYRFLREFALHAARSKHSFDEFGKADLVSFSTSLAPDLDAVPDPPAFVEEIIERSGLLTDMGETGRYVFAHRSIQEFLAAEELRLADNGTFLLGRADDPEWRQVIQFYSAGLEQRQANAFLPRLSRRNQELAGYCLAVAKASDDAAINVLDALQTSDGARLTALAAATMSPRLPVQQMAISRLAKALSSPQSPLAAINGEVDTMLPLMGSLAGTNAAQIAGLVPQIIKHVPDDPRLVEPLWRCLTAPGIEKLTASHSIVARLLTLATSQDGFEELARQEPYSRDFLTEDIRRSAYPFNDGLGRDHNLVTLLAWADYLQVRPTDPNRYFEAKDAGRLDRVESDRRHTLVFSPFRGIMIFNAALILIAFAAAAVVVATDPDRLISPFGWFLSPTLILAATLVPQLIVYLGCGTLVGSLRYDSRLKYYIGLEGTDEDAAHIVLYLGAKWARPDWLINVFAVGLAPLAIALGLLPAMAHSLAIYSTLTLVSGLLYCAPILDAFNRDRRYYLYRASPYIDVYDDPRSRNWVAGVTC